MIQKWIVDALRRSKQIWGIGNEWSIVVELMDNPGGSSSNMGAAHYSYRYLNATIDLRRTIKQSPLTRRLILHEVGHLAMAEIDEAVEKILVQVDSDRRGFFRELYEDAQEKFLQRTSRCFLDYAEGVDDGNGTGTD
jgi:hypothetical protein